MQRLTNKDRLRRQIEDFCKNIDACNTARAYRGDLHQFLSFLDALQTDASAAGPVHVLRYINKMRETRSANTLNRQIGTLQSFYEYLVAKGISKANPAEGISKLPFESQVNAPTLCLDQARRLLAAPDITTLSGSRDRLVLLLLLLLALRRSEVCRIKLKDLTSHTLTINGNKTRGRLLEIGYSVIEEIGCYQNRFRKFTGQQLQANDYLIQSGDSISSLPIHDSTIRSIVRRNVTVAQVPPNITPESCRMFAIQEIQSSAVSESDIVKLLGNHSLGAGHSTDSKNGLYEDASVKK